MCTIKFSIELNTFQIDDEDITTNDICEKKKSANLYNGCLISESSAHLHKIFG